MLRRDRGVANPSIKHLRMRNEAPRFSRSGGMGRGRSAGPAAGQRLTKRCPLDEFLSNAVQLWIRTRQPANLRN